MATDLPPRAAQILRTMFSPLGAPIGGRPINLFTNLIYAHLDCEDYINFRQAFLPIVTLNPHVFPRDCDNHRCHQTLSTNANLKTSWQSPQTSSQPLDHGI
jgi:hypothetical protein